MDEQEIKLTIGGLLYQIDRVCRTWKASEFPLKEKEWRELIFAPSVSIKDRGDLSHILYMANEVAAKASGIETTFDEKSANWNMPMKSIFNHLNGKKQKKYYTARFLENEMEPNYPIDEKEPIDAIFFEHAKKKMDEILKQVTGCEEDIHLLLEMLEDCLSYVPAGTKNGESSEISFYEYKKITAALAGCIFQYLKEKQTEDFYQALVEQAGEFQEEKAFLLYSVGVSGIQDFIYTIHSQKAIRMLRARSFYLEIMMEHIVDEILNKLSLSRCNLLYSGGGHCHMIFPNTDRVRNMLDQIEEDINSWFLDHFKNSLYIGMGYASCSANDLQTERSRDVQQTIDQIIGEKKLHRYSAKQIHYLNQKKESDYSKECKVCKVIGKVDEEGLCDICSNLTLLSNAILHEDFFAVEKEGLKKGVPLPGGYILTQAQQKKTQKKEGSKEEPIRVYAKNKSCYQKEISTRLWAGDYTTGDTFEDFAKKAAGIGRIGVLRADVDNLGQTFVKGFQDITISKTTALSRQLSLFFKFYIRHILLNGSQMIGEERTKRNITIVYSGGDDIFFVGSWNDIVGAAIDLRNALVRFTQGTLTISGGIGFYRSSYPLNAIAREVARWEDASKQLSGKDALTIFDDGDYFEENGKKILSATYHWDEFVKRVIEEKYDCIEKFFETSTERGTAFLYHLLDLIRKRKDKINIAHYIYLLSRLEPEEQASEEEKTAYREFSGKMYEWIKSEEDSRELKTAIYLYLYVTREDIEDEN